MGTDLMYAEKIVGLETAETQELFDRRALLQAEKKAIESELGELNALLGTEMIMAEVKSVMFDDSLGRTWRFSVNQSEGRKTLSKKLLVENGVDIETIEASTKQGDPYTSLSVTEIVEKESNE